MKSAVSEQEEVRLNLLRGYSILDSGPEEDFDALASLAAQLCDTPVAFISLVEADRQWFKAKHGHDVDETPIEASICAHAVSSGDYLEIQDTTKDARTADNPMVTGPDNVRFYAGALLSSPQGLPLGTLCVLDRKPRTLTAVQRKSLHVLANQVMRLIDLREALATAEMLRKEVDHRVKNSLQSLEALIRIQTRNETSEEVKAALEAVQRRLGMVSKLHEALYLSDAIASVDINAFLGKVLQSASMQMPAEVETETDIDPLNLDSRAASSVGMILTEAITNTSKYAFDAEQRGTFEVKGRHEGDSYTLIFSDNGNGMEDDTVHGTGMGTRIMQAAAQQLGGTLEVDTSGHGHRIVLTWPLD